MELAAQVAGGMVARAERANGEEHGADGMSRKVEVKDWMQDGELRLEEIGDTLRSNSDEILKAKNTGKNANIDIETASRLFEEAADNHDSWMRLYRWFKKKDRMAHIVRQRDAREGVTHGIFLGGSAVLPPLMLAANDWMLASALAWVPFMGMYFWAWKSWCGFRKECMRVKREQDLDATSIRDLKFTVRTVRFYKGSGAA